MKNCWEVMECHTDNQCPAKTEIRLNGIHNGRNAGRACWVVAGTRCGGEAQGRFAQKSGNCLACKFYQQVFAEESDDKGFKGSAELLHLLK